jgi:hypothetical protein
MVQDPAAQIHSAVDWLEREDNIIEGLDHLGIEVVSINLYSFLLPGITNVTERARYYSFYPWVLHRFAQNSSASYLTWCQWLRRLDFAYAFAVYHSFRRNSGASVGVSVQTGTSLLNRSVCGMVDIQSSTQLDKSEGSERWGIF